jgi:signal transduction histidine kinase
MAARLRRWQGVPMSDRRTRTPAVLRVFADRRTWLGLLFLVSALPLGTIGLVLVVTGWSTVLALAITPAVVPLLIAFAAVIRLAAAGEAWLARTLLGAETTTAPPRQSSRGFWRRGLDAVTGRRFWKGQAYLLLRFLLGFPTALLQIALLSTSLGAIAAPIYYRWVPQDGGPKGPDLGAWRVDTLGRALLLVPAGLVLLVATVHLIRPLAAAWRGIAGGLLGGAGDETPLTRSAGRRALAVHGAVALAINLLLLVIWAATAQAYFWPEWTLLVFGMLFAIHGWILWLYGRHDVWGRGAAQHALAIQVGVSAILFVFFVAVWAVTGAGYFWPVWPLIAFLLLVAIHWAVLALRGDGELARRVERLEETRAGAVDVQESDLRRIERDLHDGAQARLVALGMSLGRAEQKLDDDPAAARELVAEARVGVEEALRELRDLARGIRPPVLADRGLEAAISSLADRSPLAVAVHADVSPRPAGAVETAAYFVVAETLTNAVKHSRATRVDVRLQRRGDVLSVEVADDGAGGADPAGGGLTGLRRRVEALDGTLALTSPDGGPTVVRVELPCGS